MTSVKLDTRRVDQICRDLKVNTETVLTGLAIEIEGRAKMIAREKGVYDTTALINSIYTATQKHDGYSQASGAAQSLRPGVGTEAHPRPNGRVVARVGPCVEYALYQELGTSRMAGRPYLVPAAEQIVKDFNDPGKWKGLLA